jgi:hypothetical protein
MSWQVLRILAADLLLWASMVRGSFPEEDDRRPWCPEPLQLPVEKPNNQSHEGSDRDSSTEEDLPGSHVVVIELA